MSESVCSYVAAYGVMRRMKKRERKMCDATMRRDDGDGLEEVRVPGKGQKESKRECVLCVQVHVFSSHGRSDPEPEAL